jgi:glycine/D-amino acid oxidase-like deaminating enzyme
MDLTGGYPFWLIKNGLPYDYPALEKNENAEVIILGGGISGALSAYFLCEEGIDCVLLDCRTIGTGSTCASTALLQYELDLPLSDLSNLVGKKSASRVYQLSSHAIDKLILIMAKIQFHDFEKKRSMYFSAKKEDAQMLSREFEARKDAGFKVEFLDKNNISEQFGFSADAGILSQQGASVNAYMLTHSLIRHAMKKGLRVYDRTAIVQQNYLSPGIEIRTSKGNLLRAKLLVNATGYEAVNLIGKDIAKLFSTYAVAGESQSTESKILNANAILWNTDNPYLYLRTTNDKRIMIGGRDDPFKNAALRDKRIDKKTDLLKSDLKKLFPEIDFVPEFSWAGTFATTKDSIPYIGVHEKFPDTFFALGFGGNGITFSVVAAEILVDFVKGRKNEDADLFSFDR